MTITYYAIKLTTRNVENDEWWDAPYAALLRCENVNSVFRYQYNIVHI